MASTPRLATEIEETSMLFLAVRGSTPCIFYNQRDEVTAVVIPGHRSVDIYSLSEDLIRHQNHHRHLRMGEQHFVNPNVVPEPAYQILSASTREHVETLQINGQVTDYGSICIKSD